MNRQNIYLVLALLGLAIPYWFFFKFLNANGLNISLFIQQLLDRLKSSRADYRQTV